METCVTGQSLMGGFLLCLVVQFFVYKAAHMVFGKKIVLSVKDSD